MKKLLEEHRKRFGEFEVIDFVDESRDRRACAARSTPACRSSIHWTWEYGSEVAELRALYEKGKVNQWNAETRPRLGACPSRRTTGC